MTTQNFSNHKAKYSFYQKLFLVFTVLILGASILNFCNSDSCLAQVNLDAIILTALSLAFIAIFYLARAFAIKVQDRAIRAEESLRFYVLTGKLPDARLTLRQIIALRFASDEELVELAKKATEANLTPKEIKSQIKNWRPDYDRT